VSYEIILADPLWSYRDSANAGKRGAVHKYRTGGRGGRAGAYEMKVNPMTTLLGAIITSKHSEENEMVKRIVLAGVLVVALLVIAGVSAFNGIKYLEQE
jgi:hypothetical protein